VMVCKVLSNFFYKMMIVMTAMRMIVITMKMMMSLIHYTCDVQSSIAASNSYVNNIFLASLSSLASFRRQLKMELFARSFPDSDSSAALCI